MTAHFPNLFERSNANAIARRFAKATAIEYHKDAGIAFGLITEQLANLLEIPCTDADAKQDFRNFVGDTCAGLLKKIADVQVALQKDLDNHDTWEPLGFDVEAVKELLKRVSL